MDLSFYVVTYGVLAVIGLLLAYAAWTVFHSYKSMKNVLKREGEMTAVADGTIIEVVTVRRRNRSFRWVNEYPVVSYEVNGKKYTVHVTYAEKRRGKYAVGGSYPTRYVPSDPECCIVDAFKKKLKQSCTASLVSLVLVAILAFNVICSLIGSILGALI